MSSSIKQRTPFILTSFAIALLFLTGSSTSHAQVMDMGTTTPIISGIVATSTGTSTATISLNTDQQTTTQLFFGLTPTYTASSSPGSTLATSHMFMLSALTPNTLYHFQIMATNASGTQATSSDMTFMTHALATSTTATSTTATTTPPTDHQSLLNRIAELEQQIAMLQAQLQAALNNNSGSGNNGGTGTTTPSTGAATIMPTNISVRAGTSVDFNGRGFGIEENVWVKLNDQTIATAHADGGGNFSTGSLPIPWNASSTTQTYTFTGQNSGIVKSATVTVVP